MIDDSQLHDIVRRVVGRTLQVEKAPPPQPAEPRVALASQVKGPIALGADHGGFEMKEALKAHLEGQGYTVIDCGTHSPDSVDYPDFARAVARLVGEGKAWRGVMVDGAGIGSCMVANKVPGVRASMCYDHATANNAREHNDANLLTLGSGLIGIPLARSITEIWLTTPFAGGRHARRVDKIKALDRALATEG